LIHPIRISLIKGFLNYLGKFYEMYPDPSSVTKENPRYVK
jgi:hypothetical protein